MLRTLAAAAAGLLAGLAALVPAPAAAQPPRLEIEAPPYFAAEAGRLRWFPPTRLLATMGLLGLADGGPPIRVVLAAEGSPAARGVPRWVAGYALSEQNVVVLLPNRVPVYPYDSLDALLHHEVAHVLLHRAAGGRELPRWFHEGVALLASRGWSLEDRSRLLLGGVSGVPASTAELEAAFAGEGYSISTAYAVAGALAQHLVQRHGAEAIAAIAARVRRGEPFPAAFAAATGTALPRFEEGFWRRFRLFYRWLPFLSSGATLWAAVTLLALAAIARRRQRDAAVKRRWDEEERLAAELAALREELHPRRRPGSDESVH